MLRGLNVRDLAVLGALDVEFESGFIALTGETGAGKSMLVDALALAVGARADSAVVAAAAPRAEVTAVFALQAGAAPSSWLRERDLEDGAECQLRRVIAAEGRSKGYINGRPVPLELLRELGAQLVEICSQHEHQKLVQRAAQRELLDAHGGHEELRAEVTRRYKAWQLLVAEHRSLHERGRERAAARELVGYQLRELEALNLRAGEIEELERERLLLANSGRIATGLELVLDRLHDAERTSAHDAIGAAVAQVQELLAFDGGLRPAADALDQAQILLKEAVATVRQRREHIEHDPARQDELESRLASAAQLARAHRAEATALWRRTAELESELRQLTTSQEREAELALELRTAEAELQEASQALRLARHAAAASLAEAATANLRALGMPHGRLTVSVAPAEPGPTGSDQVEFLVSTNPGQAAGPVERVASGGELSRLSLAIRVAAPEDRDVATLIFDEVDAGIGGGVAELVGQHLRRLSGHRQVLCVTHLAQVATQADHHFGVVKSTSGDTSRASIRELTQSARIEEVARMLGGVRITERTRDHAREMLRGMRRRRSG